MTKTRNSTNPDHISQISTWFEKAVPTPNERNIHTQLGVHFEEIAEMLDVIKGAGTSQAAREKLTFAADVMHFTANQLKALEDGIDLKLEAIDRIELLDAICDQVVTGVGSAHMFDLDVRGGLKEVADSNDSKFDEDGKPIFNEHQKIMKGPNYFRPQLEKYV